MYVLDTDIIIAILKNNAKVLKNIKELTEDVKIYTTIINMAELYYGAYHSQQVENNLIKVKKVEERFKMLSLTKTAIIEYGKIKSRLNQEGIPLADNDLFIASITKCRNFILVTHNTRHFKRIPGLKIEDWLE